MDVPFINSGALSRAHYSLVRKVESPQSPQAVDQILLSEIDGIRRSFAVGGLSLVRKQQHVRNASHKT
jgi:AP-4 complex subunit epsilon-1